VQELLDFLFFTTEDETIYSFVRIYIKLLMVKGGLPLLKKILKSLIKNSHQHKYSSSSGKKYKHYKHSHLGHDYYKKKKKSGSFFSSFFSS
jgi:hypothetical protein